MANPYFAFKQFSVRQDRCGMKVTTDGCLFGAYVAQKLSADTVLDIGTGTGLLSLMYLQQHPRATITAVEIEKDAAMQAKENADAFAKNGEISVVNADITAWQSPTKYELIICNPPFYEQDLKSPDAKRNLAHHSAALHLTDLASIMKKYLDDDGTIALLMPASRYQEVIATFAEQQLILWRQVDLRQSLMHGVFRHILLFSFKSQSIDKEEIVISESNKTIIYTEEFQSFLAPYYLKL